MRLKLAEPHWWDWRLLLVVGFSFQWLPKNAHL